MKGDFISLKDGKAWRCPNGHLMGVMVRERDRNGNGRAYHLYKLATALEIDPAPEVPLEWTSRHKGTCYDILCEVCETRKTWWAGRYSPVAAQDGERDESI